MEQIRIGTFETNSSSTHTLVITTEELYDKFVNGLAFLDYNDNLYTKEELLEKYKEDIGNQEFEEFIEDSDISSWDRFQNTQLETFDRKFETPSGDKMVAFGKYGQDG